MSKATATQRADQKADALIKKQLQQGAITVGATGAAVKALEAMLEKAGFDVGGKADSAFDARTAAALKKFEAAAGVANADGTFDQTSFSKLRTVRARIEKYDGKVFAAGQSSKQVATAQQELKKLGYDPGRTDGVYDEQTGKAVRAFKADQKIEEGPTALGEHARRELRKETSAFDHAAYRGRYNAKNKKEHQRLDQATATAAGKANPLNPFERGIGPGSPARVIKNVQAHLKAAGYDPKNSRGNFDERTGAAVRAFQKKEGLEQTGRVDPKTWSELQKQMFAAKNATSPAQAKGEHSAAVLRSEKVLRGLGYKHVKADGVFDAATQKASRAFEKKYGGNGKDGSIGAQQLQRMEAVLRAKKHPGSGPTVSNGYKGKPVKQLEQRLKQLGFKPGKVDGKFDKKTATAVRRFQKAFNLGADGVAGKKTWRALGIKAKGSVTAPGKRVTAYVAGVPRKITVSSVGNGEYLRTDAATKFKAMMAAAHKAGFNLYANSGFRSMAEQRHLYALFQAGQGATAAPPGYSNHQNGIAMDVGNVGAFGSSAYNWLARNASRFGFNNVEGRGVGEPWHWVYQG
ncbi:MAG: peptidoglycan-binding protein [Archangiaceae bacterium]|nr:peptidoglycan-binding protein [Archangiaceae bacterium]